MRVQVSTSRWALLLAVVALGACATSASSSDDSASDDSGDASSVDGSGGYTQDSGASGHDATAGDSSADAAAHPDAAHDATVDALVDAPADSPFILLDGPCGPGNCGWCCTSTGQCLAGPSDTECGANGAACTDCTQNAQACNTATGVCMVPLPCGATTCPNGCCTAAGCQNAEVDTQCGQGGHICADCTLSGDVCTSGTCAPEGGVPDPFCVDDCDGCCDANNFCFTGSANNACGTFGGTCNDCTTNGATCIGGFCALPDGAVEDPDCVDDCTTGCCDALGICQTGMPTDVMCGQNGATCTDCTANSATCVGGFCVLPDGAVEDPNCELDCNGCCDQGNVCQAGTSRTQCGSFGEACQDCGSSLVCVGMTCQ